MDQILRNDVHQWSNKDFQKLILFSIFIVTFVYVLFFSWFPWIQTQLSIYNEKSNILSKVNTIVKSSNSASVQNEKSNNNGTDSKHAIPFAHTKTKDKELFKLSRTKTGSKSKIYVEQPPTSSSTEKNECTTSLVSESIDRKVSRVPNPAHYAPAPVIVLSEAQKKMLNARKLKEQQDLAYAQSIAEDEIKKQKEEIESELRAVKAARIASIRSAHIRELSVEESIKLSFRFSSRSNITNSSPADSNSTPWIKDGNVLGGNKQQSSQKVTNVFSVHDTIEYVLDYVEGLDAFNAVVDSDSTSTSNSTTRRMRDVSFELSLSYPTRVINRSLDPTLTLKDMNVTTDSLVWVNITRD